MADTSENKPEKYISIGLLAHVDAGKTTLSEGLLYAAGMIRQMGRVDKQNAYLDTDAYERERGITIFSKQAMLKTPDCCIALLDTPGHVDFSAEMERTLQVLDYAVLVISGADGVQGHTKTLWQLLRAYQIPCFIFVNKMDQPGTDADARLEELKRRLSDGCVSFEETESERFFEEAAMCGEEALDEFLDTGKLKTDTIRGMIAECRLFPCYFGSALKDEGVREFLQGICKYSLQKEYPEEFGAKVFKIARDEAGQRLTYLKITGGSLKVRTPVGGADKSWEEKVSQIRIYSGEKYEAVNEASAGMICAVTGLSQTRPGEGIGIEDPSAEPALEPVLTYRILLPEGCDAVQMLPKFKQLEEEEPELHLAFNKTHQEILVQVMGEVQTEILKRQVADRFGVEIEFDTGHILYKETIASAVEGVGHFEPLRHYAEVHLLMEPGERGSGIRFASACSEDVLAKNWQRLILTHLAEKEHAGVLTGAAITDIKITLAAGRAHEKHTEGGDFRQAVYRAVRQGLMQAESVLLEPYYEYRLELPEGFLGRAMTDLEMRGAAMNAPKILDGTGTLAGKAPVSALQEYAKEVAAYTKGSGRLSLSYGGYGKCCNPDEVIAETAYDPLADLDNPAGSVFCSHGAGVYVEWDHVKEHMHLESVLQAPSKESGEVSASRVRDEADEKWISVEEVDAILSRTFDANRRGSQDSRKQYKTARRTVNPESGRAPGIKAKREEPKEEYLLVDGYNIIYAWEDLRELSKQNMDGARGRLLDILSDYQGMKNCRLIVVFDAYRVAGHGTEVLHYHNICVVYTKEAETADAFIEKFAHENGKKYHVSVATSDGLEQIIIRGEGCSLLSAKDLRQEIDRIKSEMAREHMRAAPGSRNYLLDGVSEEVEGQIQKALAERKETK